MNKSESSETQNDENEWEQGNDNSENKKKYVSLIRIPEKQYYVFAWIFSTLIIVYTLGDIFTDWAWKNTLGETLFTRIAVLMTLIVGWFFIGSNTWEAIMLGYAKVFKDRIFAKGEAKGEDKVLTALANLAKANKGGITVEQAIETYKTQKGNQNKRNTSSK